MLLDGTYSFSIIEIMITSLWTDTGQWNICICFDRQGIKWFKSFLGVLKFSKYNESIN
jgi:hypothetical protein